MNRNNDPESQKNYLERDTSGYFAELPLEAEQEEIDIARALSSSAKSIDFDVEP